MSKSAPDAEAKKMIFEAYDLALKALEIKEDHWAVQKWAAVLLDSKSNFEGKKARIQQLFNVKKHMLVILQTIQLNFLFSSVILISLRIQT